MKTLDIVTTLKTLKDIEISNRVYNEKILKAEAVKWVKEFREAQMKQGEDIWSSEKSNRIHNKQKELIGESFGCNEYDCESGCSEAICQFIITFFNLTEKDLQEKKA